jgi:hypothetical protein
VPGPRRPGALFSTAQMVYPAHNSPAVCRHYLYGCDNLHNNHCMVVAACTIECVGCNIHTRQDGPRRWNRAFKAAAPSPLELMGRAVTRLILAWLDELLLWVIAIQDFLHAVDVYGPMTAC